jgi:hypothetical protein
MQFRNHMRSVPGRIRRPVCSKHSFAGFGAMILAFWVTGSDAAGCAALPGRSTAWTTNESSPRKPSSAAVYSMVSDAPAPPAFTTAVPCAGGVSILNVSGSPSAS